MNFYKFRLLKWAGYILGVLGILVAPLSMYAAPLPPILPKPTGTCPSLCGEYEQVAGLSIGKCKTEIPLKCVSGKCVGEGATPNEFSPPCNYSLQDIVQSGMNFVNLILGIAGSLALLMFFYGGYQFFIAMGNPEALQKGKKTIVGGFIGLMIILFAGILVQFAGGLLGAKVSPEGIIYPSHEVAETSEKAKAEAEAEAAAAGKAAGAKAKELETGIEGCCKPLTEGKKCKASSKEGSCPAGYEFEPSFCTDVPECAAP